MVAVAAIGLNLWHLRRRRFFPHPQVLLFGDSLTQWGMAPAIDGWALSLAHWYIRRADVVNRGMSGYNSRWALELLPLVLREISRPPALATVWLGANDAADAKLNPRQHVGLGEYAENLRGIILGLRSSNPKVAVVVITPPPVNSKAWLKYCNGKSGNPLSTSDRSSAQTSRYASAARTVAGDLNCALVDLWAGEWAIDPELHLSDGLHLNGQGNQVVAKAVQWAISSRFPQLVPNDENMPFLYPAHSVIDPVHFQRFFR